MNIIGNINDSLQYPLKNWLKLIIVGVILMIPILNIIGLGYCLRVIKSTLTGLDRLPDFDSFGELFIDGIKIIIVSIIYAIIPLIVFAVSFIAGSVLILLIAIISAMIISIFAYIGIANMAYYNGEIVAALRYREILNRIMFIGLKNYIIWWIVLMLIITISGLVIGIVGGILLFYILGFIVFSLGYGYLAIFQARSVALIFASINY